MKPEFERESFKRNAKYYAAEELMNCIISHNFPDYSVLVSLFNPKNAGYIRNMLQKFYEENSIDGYKLRQKKVIVNREVYSARTNLENNILFKNIHSALLNFRIPEKEDLKIFFGSYAESIRKIYGTYIEMELLRKCDLTAASHLNRVAGVAKQLNFDKAECFDYAAIASMHDSIEDLLTVAKDNKGNLYGIENYSKFLTDFVPANLQESVKILTNHYNLILSYLLNVLKGKDKSFNRKNILNELEILRLKRFPEINSYVEKIYFHVLDNKNIDKQEDVLDYIKWQCYEKLYLNQIAETSKIANNFLLFEIKGVDLFDNFHGKDSLSLEGRIRNVIKNILWVNLGESFHSDWIPLNNHIAECTNDSLTYAENLIIKDLLEVQSQMDFFVASLNKVKKLFNVFYTH